MKLGANLPHDLVAPKQQFVLPERANKPFFDYQQSIHLGNTVEQKVQVNLKSTAYTEAHSIAPRISSRVDHATIIFECGFLVL